MERNVKLFWCWIFPFIALSMLLSVILVYSMTEKIMEMNNISDNAITKMNTALTQLRSDFDDLTAKYNQLEEDMVWLGAEVEGIKNKKRGKK